MGDSSGVGLGDGDDLRFFFLGEALGEESGAGPGEAFFFFRGEGEALGSGSSVGVGPAADFFFFEEAEGEGDFSGVGDGFGVGDFSASSFFFVVELLRCFRGVGVGVGAKIFFILLPIDSSDRARSPRPVTSAIKRSVPMILLIRRMERERSTRARDE